MEVHVKKTIPISYQMVVAAYRKVKQGGKSSGIDGESWRDFERKGVEKALYVIWNRMASGSYFPKDVKEVEIPKKNGKTRKLGIPTIRDRIAQEVVKHYMETRIDEKFHPNSYGYRPLKSSRAAISQVRKNCYKNDWVVDMDISKFFDEIDHKLLLKGLEAMGLEKWVIMYVQRWLKMKIVKQDTTIYDRGNKGTPQGGVISPILANVFLHYGLDLWLEKNYPQVSFVRYADDVILHCKSKAEAESLLSAIKTRMSEIGLALNETKTKIVYCKDYKRKGNYKEVHFEFLGFSYRPRPSKSKIYKSRKYTIFSPEISQTNQKKIRETIRELVNWRNTSLEIRQIAKALNSRLRGWINYFGIFGKRQLRRTMLYLNTKLLKWMNKKHKQGVRKSVRLFRTIQKQKPNMFYHWEKGYC